MNKKRKKIEQKTRKNPTTTNKNNTGNIDNKITFIVVTLKVFHAIFSSKAQKSMHHKILYVQ
jgi:hypothetical protein